MKEDTRVQEDEIQIIWRIHKKSDDGLVYIVYKQTTKVMEFLAYDLFLDIPSFAIQLCPAEEVETSALHTGQICRIDDNPQFLQLLV